MRKCLNAAGVQVQGTAVQEIERLVKEGGFRAVRFNPYLWPDGEKMSNAVGRAMYAKCAFPPLPCLRALQQDQVLLLSSPWQGSMFWPSIARGSNLQHTSSKREAASQPREPAAMCRAGELGVPVGHMPFKGLLRHIEEIRTLAAAHPETKVIIDHFGFCQASDPTSAEWQALLALAELPQVFVKVRPAILPLCMFPGKPLVGTSWHWTTKQTCVEMLRDMTNRSVWRMQTSAFFRISAEEHPYSDTHRCVRQLITAFGAQRLMYGSDFPWVTEKCGYDKAWDILPAGFLSEEEAAWIMGGTAAHLLNFDPA